jgi:type III secretion protein R
MSLLAPALAQTTMPAPGASGLVFWLVLLAGMALAPFVLTMITSFAKFVIVGSILRHAMGTQQIPPTTVITGLALILTIHTMAPVAMKMWGRYVNMPPEEGPPNAAQIIQRSAGAVEPPMRDFLIHYAHPDNIAMFEDLGVRLDEANHSDDPRDKPPEITDPLMKQLIRDATILTPAFMLSQLTEAFQIGFLLFVPFLVIDLVVSNILMAMGMQMLSPVTVSMPLKLLLFVLIDGWRLVMQGLVMGYT